MKLLLLCLGLHYVADFTLQGWLAQAKCKLWWRKYAPDKLYQDDWLCALLAHSIYWTLVTFAPVIYFWDKQEWRLLLLVLINSLFHATVDNEKANLKTISLGTDQTLHLLQIVITLVIFKYR